MWGAKGEVDMIFNGQAFQLSELNTQFVHLTFDLLDEPVNKFNRLAVDELEQVVELLETASRFNGLIISSAKKDFIVGADITEFGAVFAGGEAAITAYLNRVNTVFSRFEDLPFPSVAVIQGYCLGGGTELALACDYRLLATDSKIGLPETRLGIIPGWGGTVRLPRIAGLDIAIDWIASAKDQTAAAALKAGVASGVVADDKLMDSALKVLEQACAGKLAYRKSRQRKQSPLAINDTESLLAFESAKALVKAKAGYHYPAPVDAIKAMQAAAKCGRDAALNIETEHFTRLAVSATAANLVGVFLSDQVVAKTAKSLAQAVDKPVARAAVLGAGVMGGGIAYQTACQGLPVIMKDVAQSGLDLGMTEAEKLLAKQLKRGRIDAAQMANIASQIHPTLRYSDFDTVDLVVEAVVEKLAVKQAVLAEVEQQVREDTVLCSNTSSLSICKLAEALQRPGNFCGMHFFNPVHRMPLVEVIRGVETQQSAINQAVAFALALGKKAIVVEDCPGFFVNRVLFPYFAGFAKLLHDGAHYQQVDKIMERWGWPMGPAQLMDVVGIDIAAHAGQVMAESYPERMSPTFASASDALYQAGRLGQKTDAGFYDYVTGGDGKKVKTVSQTSYHLIAQETASEREFSEEEVVARLMVPMAIECNRCLEEGIVASVVDADMALIYGLGFPAFRGGIFRWLDTIGPEAFKTMREPLEALGPLYHASAQMQLRERSKTKFYAE